MASKRTIIALLKNLGLTTNEAKIYLSSLKLGEVGTSEIAKEARVNRSNAYNAVQHLADYGLIEQVITPTTKRIHAAPIESLEELAKKRQKEATKLRWKIADLIPALFELLHNESEQPRFLSMEGKGTLIRMLKRTNKKVRPGSEIIEFCCMTENESEDTERFSRTEYIPGRVALGCTKRMLCSDNKKHRALLPNDRAELRETRFLTDEQMVGIECCNLNIYDNEIFFYWESPQPHGVIIQSTKISNLMRFLFNIAWKQASSMKN
jgi:sugar-specific transcriptional regulator TrmB